MRKELQDLIKEQSKDDNYIKVTATIINPAKERAFSKITDCRKRHAFILFSAGETDGSLSKSFCVASRTIRRWVAECRDVYPDVSRIV